MPSRCAILKLTDSPLPAHSSPLLTSLTLSQLRFTHPFSRPRQPHPSTPSAYSSPSPSPPPSACAPTPPPAPSSPQSTGPPSPHTADQSPCCRLPSSASRSSAPGSRNYAPVHRRALVPVVWCRGDRCGGGRLVQSGGRWRGGT